MLKIFWEKISLTFVQPDPIWKVSDKMEDKLEDLIRPGYISYMSFKMYQMH